MPLRGNSFEGLFYWAKRRNMNQILVVGYKGEIGSFILNGLLRTMPKALDIFCVDVNETEEEAIERIKVSDTVFLCIPMGKTVDWLETHKWLLKGKVIVEQCSLKEWIYNEGGLKELDIRSMHVLFRPSQTPDKKDRKVALFKGQFDEEMAKKIQEITGSEIVWLENAKEHDKEMAITQALTHRTLLLLGDALKGCHGSTYISKKVTELSDRIKQGDLGLYKSIQENRHLGEHLDKMTNRFKEFKIEDYWK
jgi:prephenate dehydrogenase